MAKRADFDIRAWALIGAEQRLLQLAEEAAAIHREFPELRQRTGRRGRTAANAPAEPAAPAKGRRGSRRGRRRTMSAEGRRRISEAQKARWARQRAGGTKKK